MEGKIGLKWKVALTIVAVGVLPLTVGLVWAGYHGKTVLIAASGEKFTELAKQMAGQIEFVLEREIHEARSLALSEELRRAVALSDAAAEGGGDPSVRADRPQTENPASSYLRAYQSLKGEEYEVIFATDRRGDVVASSLPLQRTNHAAETWWQAAFQEGRGATFLSDMYWADGSSSPRIDLALPVYDRQRRQALGVLKFVVKDLELDEILRAFKIGRTGHAMLADEAGRILICPIRSPASHTPVRFDEDSEAGWMLQPDGHGDGETVVAFSRIAMSNDDGLGEPGIRPWRVVVTQERAELFAPIRQALWEVSGLGAGLMGILVLFGVLAGRRLTRPVLVLQRGAERLAQGDLGHRLRFKTDDELDALARTINQMAEGLQRRTSDLTAARDYLKNIIEQSAALIITADPAWEIKEFNRGAEEVLGYGREAARGKKLEIVWDDPQEFHQVISQVATQGRRIHYETVFSRGDGTPVPVSCSLAQLTDGTGRPSGLVLVGEDLTDRKELETARLEAERLTALHRLCTLLTHDLRSPMVGILKALSLLQETYGRMPESQARRIMADLIRGGDLLMGTLNDLLDVYRHSLSALPLRCADFHPGEAVLEIIRLVEADAQTRRIKLEFRNDAPEAGLFADRRRIQRVVFNLLDNAVKYSPSGGRVVLHMRSGGEGGLSLSVDDEGPGIPEAEASRIFDFLYQTSPGAEMRTERGGMGVGLYFCRITVEAHGGSIKAENRPGGGARFTINLPVCPSGEDAS